MGDERCVGSGRLVGPNRGARPAARPPRRSGWGGSAPARGRRPCARPLCPRAVAIGTLSRSRVEARPAGLDGGRPRRHRTARPSRAGADCPPQSRQQLVLNAGARGRAPGRDRRGGRGGAGGVGARHALGPPFKRGGAIGAAAAALPPRLEWRRARYRAPLLPAYSSPFAQRAQLWSPLPTPPFTSPPPPPPSRPPAPPPPCPRARARPAGGGPRRGTGRGRARGSSGRPRACSRAP